MMTCAKTGCHIYDQSHDRFLYGDAFEANGVALFRVVQISHEQPIFPVIHYDVEFFDLEFKDVPTGTFVATAFVNNGYDGRTA